MAQYAELEISLRRREAAGYPVEMRFVAANSDSDERVPVSGSAYANIDLAKLTDLSDKPLDYGKDLGTALFADRFIATGLSNARASAKTLTDGGLRVRLYIDSGAEELHRLHWETLCAADATGNLTPLFNGDKVLFSRYLASSIWHPVQGKTDLTALIVVANFPDFAKVSDPSAKYDPFNPEATPKLAEIKVQLEFDRAAPWLVQAGVTTVKALGTGIKDSLGPADLDNIVTQLQKGFDILYLVCHGALTPAGQAQAVPDQGQAVLYLEDGRVDASKLVDHIKTFNNQPRLVVLASCQSAGGAEIASGTLSALGPLLVDAGIPAVIAMQGKVKMATIARFMPKFFQALGDQDGQIDRAMGVARYAAVDHDCDDYWMPALFMRLRTGRLWYVPGLARSDGSPPDDGIWDSINSAIKKQRCTPILGPGILDSLIGSTRDLAKEMASNKFPLAPYSREELPTVAQYMAVHYKRPLSVKEDLAARIARKLVGQTGLDPEKPENLSAILSAAGKDARAKNPLDPHTVLASKDFSLYLTTNPDSLMEDALREAGKNPRSDFNRWNKDPFYGLTNNFNQYPSIRDREPPYVPSVANPLVYHLFGQLDLPQAKADAPPPDPGAAPLASRVEAAFGSIVLTEDDFFNYLLSIGSKADAKDEMPLEVGTALTSNSLLFLGFRLDEWSFRVLLRSIFNKEGSHARMVGDDSFPCVGAQIQPEDVPQPLIASRYFQDYLGKSKIDIFWGSTAEFIQAFQKNTAPKQPA